MSQLRSKILVDSLNGQELSLNMAQHYLDKFLYSILGVEGKAGMITLYDPEEEIDLAQLAEDIKKQLQALHGPFLFDS